MSTAGAEFQGDFPIYKCLENFLLLAPGWLRRCAEIEIDTVITTTPKPLTTASTLCVLYLNPERTSFRIVGGSLESIHKLLVLNPV